MNEARKAVRITCLLVALGTFPALAEEAPLVRGEDRIDAPAIGEGLCLHNLFQSNMVIQRDKPVRVRGWADPEESVTVEFAGQRATTVAAADRSWAVMLAAMPASKEPRTMTVRGRARVLTLDNILLGDIWILSGQSNMEFALSRLDHGDLEIASANVEYIRHLKVPQLDGPEHRTSFPLQHQWSDWFKRHFRQGYWEVCTPETVRDVSGIGYVFARRLYMATRIPIGLIDTSRGGTTLETWTPDEVLRTIDTPEVAAMLAEWDERVAAFDPQQDLEARIRNYHERTERLRAQGTDVSDRTTPPTEPGPGPAESMHRPGNCYASTIAPISGTTVKGILWHQGYNNALQPNGHVAYRQIFPPMIAAWRAAFNEPDLPFGIISLCTEGEPQDLDNYLAMMPNEGVHIREVQYKVFRDLQAAGDRTVGYASSFDLRRSWFHPQIKIPAAERIARWALATQYGMERQLKWEPPVVTEVKAEDGKLVVRFNSHVRPYNDGPILGFAIAGDDGRFQPANAAHPVTGADGRGRPQHDRQAIELSSPLVPDPVHYRHAWGRNPLSNLRAGVIPLATQRSDSWTVADLYAKYTGQSPATPNVLSRPEQQTLNRLLREADLQRRIAQARALLAEQGADVQP